MSSDVVFIKTEKFNMDFDVGTSVESMNEINEIKGTKNIVLSHFHLDHIANIHKVNFDNLFVSANTKRYTSKGTIVKSKIVFENEQIEILEVPSSHAKGCLCLVFADYAFMGDSTYCKEVIGNHTYNVQLLKAEIDFLESLNCKYVCLSHDIHFVQSREKLIELHKSIYERRKATEPTISVEDFFNPDGSVKIIA